MSHIASLDYLWNEVRVKGGAYGTGFRSAPGGMMCAYSYRDPDPEGAISKIRKTGKYMKDFSESLESADDLTGFVIGTVSDSSPLLTPRTESALSDAQYIRGIDYEFRKNIRRGIIDAKPSDLAELAPEIDNAFSSPVICVVGTDSAVTEMKEIEETIILK